MRFASPEFLWLLLATPLVVLASTWVHLRRRRALERFAGGRDFAVRFTEAVSPNKRAVKLLLLYVVLVGLPLALARPQWGTRLEPVTQEGADVVIVLDTSLSMAVEDLAPSRLEQAKHAIGSLIDQLEGDRVALLTFAGQASLNCPLTVDQGAVRLFLEATDVDSVPVPGTALADALKIALGALRADEPTLDRDQAIVLFSDGEDHAGGLDEVLSKLDSNGVAVYAVGTGTTRGAPIPERRGDGTLEGYKKDRQGKVVTSRVDEALLQRVALETGGRYYRATTSELEVDEIAAALSGLDKGEFGAELRTRYEERFRVPLLIALLALAVETILGDRRRSAKRESSREVS